MDPVRTQFRITACAEVERRAGQTLTWATTDNVLLDVALDHLTLGRATFYKTLLGMGESLTGPHPVSENLAERIREYLSAAVDELRHAGQQDYLPRGLLTRAWLHSLEGNTDAACADLAEAWQIAERGPMRLHLADIHLYRARLFHAVQPYPWESPHADLAAARKLIEQCGYWRRKEELEDAEAAAQNW